MAASIPPLVRIDPMHQRRVYCPVCKDERLVRFDPDTQTVLCGDCLAPLAQGSLDEEAFRQAQLAKRDGAGRKEDSVSLEIIASELAEAGSPFAELLRHVKDAWREGRAVAFRRDTDVLLAVAENVSPPTSHMLVEIAAREDARRILVVPEEIP